MKRRYSNGPLGNSLEFMPWDTHLNQDVHASHDYHVSATSHLPEDNPNKFSGTTSKRMACSYKRILDTGEDGVAPTSERIIQDVARVLKSLELVYNAKGVLVNENINGRRYEVKDNDHRGNWGGKRKKKTITHSVVPLHHQAEVESKNRLKSSIEKAIYGTNNVNDPHEDLLVDDHVNNDQCFENMNEENVEL